MHKLLSLLEAAGHPRFHGWYAESAEGILSEYTGTPAETEELAAALDRFAAEAEAAAA